MIVKFDHSFIDEYKGKDVLLFGAGSCGQRSIEEFQKVNANIIGFIDNNIARRGERVAGYPVYAPGDIIKFPQAKIVITSTFVEPIKKQLADMLIDEVDVIRLGALHDTLTKEEFANPFVESKKLNESIREKLEGNTPFFIGRLGSNELECMAEYYYLLNRKEYPQNKYHDNLKLVMKQGAGFFPTNEEMLDQFVDLYSKNLHKLDIIWSMWFSKWEDKLYQDFIPHIPFGNYIETAFPYDRKQPWTKALEEKKVLVIHPFEESIRENYIKREVLFQNKEFLTSFDMITLKAVQSIGDEVTDYKNWFDALESMKEKIDKIDFDVALIGAGAYGFPLGGFIKDIGKKAIHVGGMLQLFFGIRAKAWDKLNIYNEYWVSPKESEHPKGYEKVEAGRYW